jgi:hypothetical protein
MKLLNVILILSFHFSAHAEYANLNQDETLNLAAEAALPDVKNNSNEQFELGTATRSWGRPTLETDFQNTTYDLSNANGLTFAYRKQLTTNAMFNWGAKVSYFDIEKNPAENTVSLTRLHIAPVQTELFLTTPKPARIKPYVAAGIMGLLAIQRGVEAAQTSEAKGLWTGRLGLDVQLYKNLGLSASYLQQKSWSANADEWSGDGYDLTLSYKL